MSQNPTVNLIRLLKPNGKHKAGEEFKVTQDQIKASGLSRNGGDFEYRGTCPAGVTPDDITDLKGSTSESTSDKTSESDKTKKS